LTPRSILSIVDIRFEAAPDRARAAAAVRHVLGPLVRQMRLTGLLLVLCGGLLLLLQELFGGILAVGLGLTFGLLAPLATVRKAVDEWWSMNGEIAGYECTDASLCVRAPLHASRVSWKAFIGVEQLPGQLLFLMTRRAFVPVPTVGLTAEQVAQLRSAVSPAPGQ
jgi:hypothetical protein